MLIAASALFIAAAWILLLLQVDPVPTWFYVFVWYPTLLLVDDVAARRGAGQRMFGQPRLVLSIFAWSAVVWLLFEAANFRLLNWYYVFLPRPLVERWAGVLLSFATVVPAILLAERVFSSVGVGRRWRGPTLAVRRWELHAAMLLGVLASLLALVWPRTFFPLVWGGVWLMLDPVVYRRHREWSLLGDIADGRYGRIGRLLASGLFIGLLWEFYNYWARGKWIYTVPWLEHTKLFEMPPFGFLGFPVFALEAWAFYHVLCSVGVAVPLSATEGSNARRVAVAAPLAIAFAIATLVGMDRWTISSTAPRLVDLPGFEPGQVQEVERAGVRSPFALARQETPILSDALQVSAVEATRMIEAARLVTLRGIGTSHARVLATLGVNTVCGLAEQDPARLWTSVWEVQPAPALNESPRGMVTPRRPTPAEVRVWVRAARKACTR